MKHESNMTSKCQVTVPKGIRDALGLKAGDVVAFTLDEGGVARIAPAAKAVQYENHKKRVLQGVMEARAIYTARGVDLGMSNTEFYDMMRGPPAER